MGVGRHLGHLFSLISICVTITPYWVFWVIINKATSVFKCVENSLLPATDKKLRAALSKLLKRGWWLGHSQRTWRFLPAHPKGRGAWPQIARSLTGRWCLDLLFLITGAEVFASIHKWCPQSCGNEFRLYSLLGSAAKPCLLVLTVLAWGWEEVWGFPDFCATFQLFKLWWCDAFQSFSIA